MYTNAIINIALEAFAGVILAIIMGSMLFDKDKKSPLNRNFVRLLCCYLLVSFFDIICWTFDGSPNPQARYILIISNLWVHALSVIGASIYNSYIITYISTKTNISKIPVYVVNAICVVHGLLLVMSQFNHIFYYIDAANYYNRGNLFWVAYLLPTIISLIQIVIVLRYRKELGVGDVLALLSYNVLLFVGAALQAAMQASMGLIMLLYVFVTVGLLIVYIRIQVEKAKKLETELADARVDIMLSQIQPHFLYNTLTAIGAVCDTDPGRAKAAVTDFAHYLRGNLESLSKKNLIHFVDELEHVETYLSMERLRFGDKLHVLYEISADDFMLPPLTLQPIVENAVQHGITKKSEGGTVLIRTEMINNTICITVSDDGTGFDTAARRTDGRIHVGIENVRKRLGVMCGGNLEIQSEAGSGTIAVITIPNANNKGV